MLVFFQLVNAQAQYHKKTLEVLEGLLPQLQDHMGKSSFTSSLTRVLAYY